MKPDHIIIHCSATKDSGTVSWAAIRKYHVGRLGWSDIGYHFGCEMVNDCFEILTGRPLSIQGAHCRAGGMNRHSLGFCFVGGFKYDYPPNDQFTVGAKYVAGLCSVLSIPVEHVQGHREHESRKTCPGAAFNMDSFRDMVRIYMGGS